MTDAAWIRLVESFMDLKRQLVLEIFRRYDVKSLGEFASKYPSSFKGFFMDDIFFI